MSGGLKFSRILNGSPIEMEIFPPNYQIGDKYTAGLQLMRSGTAVALLAFNELGMILRDVTASTPRTVAFATTPQIFDISLADGWSVSTDCRANYLKTQESLVVVICNIKSDHTPSNGETIGTLPAGFRPSHLLKVPFVAVVTGSQVEHGYMDINVNGEIKIYRIAAQVQELSMGPAIFIAN